MINFWECDTRALSAFNGRIGALSLLRTTKILSTKSVSICNKFHLYHCTALPKMLNAFNFSSFKSQSHIKKYLFAQVHTSNTKLNAKCSTAIPPLITSDAALVDIGIDDAGSAREVTNA